MCITSLHTELLRLIDEKKETPISERGKTHTFPSDLYLSPQSGLTEKFDVFLDELITIPAPKQRAYREAYRAVYEQLILNLARCVITRQWLCVAGSNSTRQSGNRKYGNNRCHIYKSESRTNDILHLLVANNLIIKNDGKAYEKGRVENHYFPTKQLAIELAQFTPFVEQEIKPSSKLLKINDPDEVFTGYIWGENEGELKDILTINEFAKHQSWTLKAPIRQTFNRNPFTAGRLITPFQNLPSRDYKIRQSTLINGNPIAEVDYNANHLRIYLASLGYGYGGSDPYKELADIAGVTRNYVKAFITVAMNCNSIVEAKAAALKEYSVPHPVSDRVNKAFEDRFKSINLYSGFGVHAMNYEGLILKEVMLTAIRDGIFTLPIHDAVACERDNAERVNEIMLDTWEKHITQLNGGINISTVTKVT
jgi:hypothetical protein